MTVEIRALALKRSIANQMNIKYDLTRPEQDALIAAPQKIKGWIACEALKQGPMHGRMLLVEWREGDYSLVYATQFLLRLAEQNEVKQIFLT